MISIRRMTPLDLDVLLPFEQELFGTESWSRRGYLDELADTDTRYYVVAEADGEVVGGAGLLVIDETAQVMTVGVLPAARRRGIGELLVAELLAEARRRAAAEVLLEVRMDNDTARRLYERAGFSVLGVRRGYFERGRVDALVMRYPIERQEVG